MNKEKVLVTGASGMVGDRFVETYKYPENLLTPDLDVFDMTRAESIATFFSSHPEISAIINFAAFTNVSESQKQKGNTDSLCYQINVIGTQNLVNQIKDRDTYIIHVSTDMVFPGDTVDPGPYTEDHLLRPDQSRLTWYGYTKALAEKLVRESLPNAAILRLIYPVVAKYDLKPDYLRAPLAYYVKNHSLHPIFTDQQMNISAVDEICTILNRLLERRLSGIFHAGSHDITTPYEIMTQLFDLVYGRHDMVKPGTVDPVRYPQFGGLLNKETEKRLGIHFSSTPVIVNRLYGGLKL